MEENEKTTPQNNPKRKMLYFQDEGLMIPLKAITTLRKEFRMSNDKPTRPEYGIIINKGTEPGSGNHIGECSVWFEDEVVRDAQLEAIMDMMLQNDFEIEVI